MHASLSTVRFKYNPLGWKHCRSKDYADEFSGEQESTVQGLNKLQFLMEKENKNKRKYISPAAWNAKGYISSLYTMLYIVLYSEGNELYTAMGFFWHLFNWTPRRFCQDLVLFFSSLAMALSATSTKKKVWLVSTLLSILNFLQFLCNILVLPIEEWVSKAQRLQCSNENNKKKKLKERMLRLCLMGNMEFQRWGLCLAFQAIVDKSLDLWTFITNLSIEGADFSLPISSGHKHTSQWVGFRHLGNTEIKVVFV